MPNLPAMASSIVGFTDYDLPGITLNKTDRHKPTEFRNIFSSLIVMFGIPHNI